MSSLQIVTLLLHSVSSQLQLSSSHLQSEGALLGLWSHEACREIRDAIQHNDDRKVFDDALVVALASHNGSTWLQGLQPFNLLYSNFADSMLEQPYDEQQKQQLIIEYTPVLTVDEQKQTYTSMCNSLQKSDVTHTGNSKELCGYETYTVESFTHLTRVTRALQLPGGCMLMIPSNTTDAVGMTSAVVRLATHSLGYKLIEAVIDGTGAIECCPSQHTYSTFRNKLRDAMLCAGGASTSGAEQTPTVLYIKDISTSSSDISTMVHDYMKDINEALSNGVVHELYTTEDVYRAKRVGGLMIADDTTASTNINSSGDTVTDGIYTTTNDDNDGLSKLQRHQAAVLLNLHIVLCFNEPQSVLPLQRRLKQYSCIHSRCSVNWIDGVSKSTLAVLAKDAIAHSDVEAVVSIPQTVVDKLASLTATLHSIVSSSMVTAAHSTVPLTPDHVTLVMKRFCDAFALHQKRVDEIALWQPKITDAHSVVNRMRNRAEVTSITFTIRHYNVITMLNKSVAYMRMFTSQQSIRRLFAYEDN
jgi:P-loop containing dynein motor region D4